MTNNRRGNWHIWLLALFLVSLQLSPILISSWSGDDWPNSQAPFGQLWRYGEVSLETAVRDALSRAELWATGQGRFYPVAHLQTVLGFTYLRDLNDFKLAQFGAHVLTATLFLALLLRIFRKTEIIVFSAVALAMSIQFRPDFDPHLAFDFLLPGMLSYVFLSSLLSSYAATSPRLPVRFLLQLLSGMVFLIAMSTYEYAFLLSPLPLLTYFWLARDQGLKGGWLINFPVIVAQLAYAILVFGYLRPRAFPVGGSIASMPGSRYALGVSSETVRVFVAQLFAPVPLQVFNFGIDLQRTSLNVRTLVSIFGISLALVSIYRVINDRTLSSISSHQNDTKRDSNLSRLAIFGFVMLAAPAAMLAIRPDYVNIRGQLPVSPDRTYLGILIGEYGMAVLITLAFWYMRTRGLFRHLGTALVVSGLMIGLTYVHNLTYGNGTNNRRIDYETWNLLTKKTSLFDYVEERDAFVSATANAAYETNSGTFYANTGIRLSGIALPLHLWGPDELSCKPGLNCALPDMRSRVVRGLNSTLLPNSDDLREKDFSWVLNQPGAMDNANMWQFEIFRLTANTSVAFLVPLTTTSDSTVARISELRLFRLVNRESLRDDFEDLKVSIGSVCLTRKTASGEVISGYEVSEWRLPSDRSEWREPGGTLSSRGMTRDIRMMGAGVC